MELNKIYSFVTLAPTILGNKYELHKVIGIVGVKEAVNYSDVYTLHNSLKEIIPNLPDIENCSFIIFENEDGNKTILAKEWIDSSSIHIVSKVNIKIDIRDISSDDVGILRSRLIELGYTNFDITII